MKLTDKKYYLALCVVALLYAIDLIFNYLNVDLNFSFGYLDQQAHWQSVHDLWSGKVIYKDFIWEYGILMLIVRLPIFLIFGQNYLSNLVNNYFFLPVLGIALSYMTAKEYLNKKSIIVFMLLAFLYRTNSDYNAIRHLIPEFGLMLIMTGLTAQNKKKTLIGSALIGLALTSSPEYAIIGGISTVFFLFFHLIKSKKHRLDAVWQTLTFPFAIGVFYLIYLGANNTIGKAITFHREHIQAFYTDSPCREFFPRPDSLGTIMQSPQGFLSNLFGVFYRLNVYAIPLMLLFLAFLVFRNKKSKWFAVELTMLFYSILAFTRTINTPCYIHYGLIFVFILTVKYAFSANSRTIVKYVCIALIIWLSIASGYNTIAKQIFGYFSKSPNDIQEYLPEAGIRIDKKRVEEYLYVKNYIESQTYGNKLVFVYPDGPYNLILKRESPVGSFSTLYSSLVPSIEKYSVKELQAGKPEFVIINKYNSSSYKSNVNGVTYNIYSSGKDIIFRGITGGIEDYINTNYDLAEKRDMAWILKRSKSPKKPLPFLVPAAVNSPWNTKYINLEPEPVQLTDAVVLKVTNSRAQIMLSNNLKGGAQIVIPVKIDIGAAKPLSKFVYQTALITNNGGVIQTNANFITSDWQDVIIDIPQLPPSDFIQTVVIALTDNLGFLPWGRPLSFSIKQPRVFILNPDLKIDDAIIK